MHHSNAQLHRRVGRENLHSLPTKLDLPLKATRVVNDIHPKEDIHQGRFAGAILTHNRVNLTRPDGKLDVLEHLRAIIAFADVSHFQQVGFCHVHRSSSELKMQGCHEGNLAFLPTQYRLRQR